MSEREPLPGEHPPEATAADPAESLGPGTPEPGAPEPGTHEPGGHEAGAHEAGAHEPGAPGPTEPGARPEVEVEVEVVDGFPVLAEVRTVERVTPASLPAVQAAAAAGAGFVAGAATVALIRRRATRKVARNTRGGSRRPADLLPIAATRSFLVDVHVIAKGE